MSRYKLRFHSAGYVVYEAQPPCARRYVVQPGDTCISIALRTQVPTYVNTLDSFFDWPNHQSLCRYQLITANQGLINPECTNLRPGEVSPVQNNPSLPWHSISSVFFLFQVICLGILGHECPRVYTVRPGDTCHSIAVRTGIPLDLLFAENPNINRPSCNNLQVNEVKKKQVFLIKYMEILTIVFDARFSALHRAAS